MNEQTERATGARGPAPDVVATACLVAIMAQGPGQPPRRRGGDRVDPRARARAGPGVSSAGALVDALHALGARRIGIVAPYLEELTRLVVAYLEDAGIEVGDAHQPRGLRQPSVAALDPGTSRALAAPRPARLRRARPVGVRADAFARGAGGGGTPQRAADGVGRDGDDVGDPAGARPRAGRAGCWSTPSCCDRTRGVGGSAPDRRAGRKPFRHPQGAGVEARWPDLSESFAHGSRIQAMFKKWWRRRQEEDALQEQQDAAAIVEARREVEHGHPDADLSDAQKLPPIFKNTTGPEAGRSSFGSTLGDALREPRQHGLARLARVPRDDELRQAREPGVGARRGGRRADREARGRGRRHLLRHGRRLQRRPERGRHRSLLRKLFGMREEYVVATKVNGRTMPGENGRGLSRKHIMASIDALARAARARLRRPLPDPPLGRLDADRGDDGGAARRREGGKGALHRREQHARVAVREGAARRRRRRSSRCRTTTT